MSAGPVGVSLLRKGPPLDLTKFALGKYKVSAVQDATIALD